MPISFIPNSTFGRYGLRQLYESRNTYLVVQLLNVPTSVSGDRSTWTWNGNWSNYVVAGAFSGTGGSLNLLSSGASPPSSITLYEEATSAFSGAYYAGEYVADSRYLRIYNNTAFGVQFTHAAFFVMQPSAASFSSMTNLNESLIFVRPFNTTTEGGTQIDAFSSKFFPFSRVSGFGGTSYTTADSFESWVNADKARLQNPAYTAPYPGSFYAGYSQNKQTSPYMADAYNTLLGVNTTNTDTTFLAELLNVTSTEPDFEEGWNGWSTYRINRYSAATVTPNITYATKQDSYVVNFGGTDYTVTWTGLQAQLATPLEFIITKPAAGSFTFTHIAVFVNEIDIPPATGTTYNYPDTDKFVGVIKLPSSVTMTTTSINRAYPFNFAFMYQPSVAVT